MKITNILVMSPKIPEQYVSCANNLNLHLQKKCFALNKLHKLVRHTHCKIWDIWESCWFTAHTCLELLLDIELVHQDDPNQYIGGYSKQYTGETVQRHNRPWLVYTGAHCITRQGMNQR